LEITYLSSAAFDVGRRSRFDRRLLKPALSTWRSTFWRFLEEGSAAPPPSSLCLRCPPPWISGLALRGAGEDLRRCSWARLGEAGGGGRGPSSAVLDGPGGGCSSSVAIGGPGGDLSSSAAPGRPDGDRSSSAALGRLGGNRPSSAALGERGSGGLHSRAESCVWRR
jgi:hypothetical protein